jgi:hypothetical protein
MAINKFLITKQTIANDQLEIATKLQDLLDDNFIEATDFYNHTVTMYGANQFLITVVYYGSVFYMLATTLGLIPVLSALRTIKRTLSTKVGLVARLGALKLTKGLSTKFGLLSSISKRLSSSSSFSSAIGIGPAIEFELISPTTFILKFGLNTIAPKLKLVARSSLSSVTGLLSSMTSIWIIKTYTFSNSTGLKARGHLIWVVGGITTIEDDF